MYFSDLKSPNYVKTKNRITKNDEKDNYEEDAFVYDNNQMPEPD
jgi:hypothetical protein